MLFQLTVVCVFLGVISQSLGATLGPLTDSPITLAAHENGVTDTYSAPTDDWVADNNTYPTIGVMNTNTTDSMFVRPSKEPADGLMTYFLIAAIVLGVLIIMLIVITAYTLVARAAF